MQEIIVRVVKIQDLKLVYKDDFSNEKHKMFFLLKKESTNSI